MRRCLCAPLLLGGSEAGAWVDWVLGAVALRRCGDSDCCRVLWLLFAESALFSGMFSVTPSLRHDCVIVLPLAGFQRF